MDRKRLARSPILWIALAVILLFALPQMLAGESPYKSVKTSEALSQITSGNVKSATIHDKESRVDLELKEPFAGKSKISASYPNDYTQTLTNDLRSKSADAPFTTKQSKQSALVSILLSLLPILLIAFVLFFVMSNLQGGGSKVMSFGRSKAKLVSKD
ncbi:MAG: ATP-dependent metallopeptidase FtsH/Yme1/Tma family protein, partial [Jatrophihabitantaceae bacterium]